MFCSIILELSVVFWSRPLTTILCTYFSKNCYRDKHNLSIVILPCYMLMRFFSIWEFFSSFVHVSYIRIFSQKKTKQTRIKKKNKTKTITTAFRMPCLKNSLSLYFFFLTFKFLYTLCFCSLWHHFTVNVEPLPPRCILMCLIIPVHNSLPHINYSTKRHYYHSCENLWFFLYIQIYSDCNVTNFE